MQDPQTDPLETSRQTRLKTVATLLVPIAVIAVAVRVLSPEVRPPARPATVNQAQNMDDVPPPPARVPAFPKGGPTPSGKVALADLNFDSQASTSAPFFNVGVRLAGDQLKLVDPQSKKTLWTGPVSRARFVQERVAAVHTIKDSQGKLLWTNAAIRAKPDLLICRTTPGQAELRDKDGTVLWSGPMTAIPMAGRSRGGPGDQMEIKTGGLIITGDKGLFTVVSDAGNVLWKGKLPVRPGILTRDGQRYHWSGRDGGEGGSDTVSTVTYESEPGRMTVTDTRGKTLGERPFSILRYEEQAAAAGDAPLHRRGARFLIPVNLNQVRLLRKGTVYLTLRDSAGRVFRRGKVYKGDKESGSSMVG